MHLVLCITRAIYRQWLLSPYKSGIKIGRNFPPTFGLKFPHFWTQILSFFGLIFLSRVKVLLKVLIEI